MKRIMGIDYGDARTGVAVSDLLCSIVGTTCVVPSRNTEKAVADIVKLAQENFNLAVEKLHVMKSTDGETADKLLAGTKKILETLIGRCG